MARASSSVALSCIASGRPVIFDSVTSKSTEDAKPRAWVEVDLGALVRNARTLERHARTRLLPMVKADAYGLGAVPVAKALDALDLYAFGVSSIAEGEELRRGGIDRQILVFTPTLPKDFARLAAAKLTPTLATAEGISTWKSVSNGAQWHLAIDTGMNRAGIRWQDGDSLATALKDFPPEGAFTHFHSSQREDGSLQAQEKRFRECLEMLPVQPKVLHAENSAAIVRRHPSPWDCVRPGVFLYGVGSGPGAEVQPEMVVHLRGQVIELRTVVSGETVSYDATWLARGPRKIATIAVGYADGYRRQLGNVGRAIVAGSFAPVVGLVTMDMLMVDVSGLPCEEGDIVTLLGRADGKSLTAETVATAAKMSPYELLTGLRQRLQRVYVGGK
jgi:alanine racemase